MCYEQGRKIYTRHFVLFILSRGEADTGFRLGLTVSRKVGRAARRNRIRRVLREFFRLRQAGIGQSIDIVVVPKRSLDPRMVDLALVEQEFSPVLSRLAREAARGVPDVRPECSDCQAD